MRGAEKPNLPATIGLAAELSVRSENVRKVEMLQNPNADVIQTN